MYATIHDLIRAYGLTEVANLLADEQHPLDADLLSAALGGNLAAYSQDEQDAARAALARAENVLAEQGAFIDGYLARRYRLPLTDQEQARTPQLRSCQQALARLALADDDANSTERMVAERKYWNAWLLQVAEGKTALPGLQAISAGSAAPQRRLAGQPRSLVDWERY